MKLFNAIKIENGIKFVLNTDENWMPLNECPAWYKWQSTSASGASRKSKNCEGTGYEVDVNFPN